MLNKNTIQTRGTDNKNRQNLNLNYNEKKPASKYALFKGKSKKEVEAESLRSLQSEDEANDSDKELL
jgi:hypothetical protein